MDLIQFLWKTDIQAWQHSFLNGQSFAPCIFWHFVKEQVFRTVLDYYLFLYYVSHVYIPVTCPLHVVSVSMALEYNLKYVVLYQPCTFLTFTLFVNDFISLYMKFRSFFYYCESHHCNVVVIIFNTLITLGNITIFTILICANPGT